MADTLSILEIDDLIDATLDNQHNYGACVRQLGKPSLKKKAYFCQDSNKKNRNSGKQNSTEKQKYSEKQNSNKSNNENHDDEKINNSDDDGISNYTKELESLPSEYREEFEELCSVLEYDLGIDREHVERFALTLVKLNMKKDLEDDKTANAVGKINYE